MSSPGKYLYDLARHIETDLRLCGRKISCVDLAFGSSVAPPQLTGDCRLKVDVGPSQNPLRSINLVNGQTLTDMRAKGTCSRGWRFTGFVRVTGPYEMTPDDCCHEHTVFTYEFTNTVMIVSESIATFLEQLSDDIEDPAGGEAVLTEYVTSYNGGAVTVGINFATRICMPSCEDLLEEEREMLGVLENVRKSSKC